jgi:hypothetical protein
MLCDMLTYDMNEQGLQMQVPYVQGFDRLTANVSTKTSKEWHRL